jgi:hypothetical protein
MTPTQATAAKAPITASQHLCAYLVSPGLQPTFIAWQRLWRPTLASRGVCWRSIIAATANPSCGHSPTSRL